jgi:hypothetical protein
MGKQATPSRWPAAVIAFAIAISAGTALAGAITPFGDDENDFEGRVERNKDTYFGFDLKSDGDKVAGVSAYLSYRCKDSMDGAALFEANDGKTLKVKGGEFSGTVEGKYRATDMRGAEPRSFEFSYDVSGELLDGGKAKGSIESRLRVNFIGGDSARCEAKDDGDWKAEKGADIDAPTPL